MSSVNDCNVPCFCAELKKDKTHNALTVNAMQCRLIDLEEFSKTKVCSCNCACQVLSEFD